MKPILALLLTSIIFLGCEKKDEPKKTEYGIAYNVFAPDSSAPDNYEVMIMDIDGNNKKNLTAHKDVAWTYNSYKNRLFFISDRDTAYRNYFLYEMDANGKNIRKVTDLRLEDSWMSSRNNCKEMVVAGRIGKEIRYQLFLVNTSTGKYEQITNDTAAMYRDPCFSPDGKQIVFAYQKDKRDRSTHEELYVMNVDGSGMKQLTTYPEDNISAKDFGYKAGPPKWHPTENFITYISKQDGRNNIFAVSPDGSKQWKLTNSTDNEGWHDWSSDGNWLAYDHSTNDESQYHIMLMNWKTKEIKQLTDTTYKYQQAPVFVVVNR
ncbi:MAG: PD40 domain-containing protein [Ignavibacteriales bacterium]|nr:MAG: PD40 domain-containing protein [Ignavibacteriales bacterium]